MKRLVSLLALVLLVGVGSALPPGEPDPCAAYLVTPEAGPWMICAASYMGQDAPELALKVVQELRNRHRYAAYVFNRSAKERQELQEELDRWQREHPEYPRRRRVRPIEDQYAVLIGGFQDVDAASKELKKVRLLPLPDIKIDSGKPAFDTYDVYEPTKNKAGMERKSYPVNPFHTAFVIRNPSIPHEQSQAKKADPLWKKLNAEEPRSLLKNPKPWTLAIAEYMGTTVIQQASASSSFLDKLGFGDNMLGKRLDAAALQAREVANLYQKFGYKTYILHTRTSSVVTVGGFDGPNDPELLRVQQQLARLSFTANKEGPGQNPLQLFAKAMPMEVPRP